MSKKQGTLATHPAEAPKLKVIPLSMVSGDLEALASRLEILDLALCTVQDRAKNGELEGWELETVRQGVIDSLNEVAKLRGWAVHGIDLHPDRPH